MARKNLLLYTKQYYLKCKNCNYLTEIIDKNVTYCFNCTRKFDNNFNSWQLKSGSNDIDRYKKETCTTYNMNKDSATIKSHNQKYKKTDLTKEERIRRTYLKEGYPLDRGGFTEWTLKQYLLSKIWYAIIIGGLLLILHLFGLFKL